MVVVRAHTSSTCISGYFCVVSGSLAAVQPAPMASTQQPQAPAHATPPAGFTQQPAPRGFSQHPPAGFTPHQQPPTGFNQQQHPRGFSQQPPAGFNQQHPVTGFSQTPGVPPSYPPAMPHSSSSAPPGVMTHPGMTPQMYPGEAVCHTDAAALNQLPAP